MTQPLRFQHFEVLTRPDGSPHLLGKGAMGLTYKAFDRNLLSLVVIKVIAPQYVSHPAAKQRFLQEAQSMARIKHPNVADVFFLGDSDQGVFYAMEFCDGPSAQEYIEEKGSMDPADVLALGLQAAGALQAVEANNLIHRDVKPSNIILVNDAQGRSQVKLIDFGLARDIMRDAQDPNLSQGGFVGTPTFASPEQLLEQENLDIRSDIYSLGITLWFMLTGRPPFAGSQFEVMFHHVNTPPPWDRLPAMPGAARDVLRRMIEKSAEDRFLNPAELVSELRHVISSEGFGSVSGARLSLGPKEEGGSILGMSSFEILAEADSDTTGKIFRAKDAHSGRIVSLKYLHPEIVAKAAVMGKIQRHVLSLRPLEHPNLAGVLGFEKSEDGTKIITEWVKGPSLLSVLKARNELKLKEAAPLLGQLAGALDFAASKGLGTVETDLHQIFLVSPTWGEDPAAWGKYLRQPVDTWKDVTLKVNPLRLSPAAQDYPTIDAPAKTDAGGGGPKPLLSAFLQLAHRLLGGAGGSQASSHGGFVSIPGLGAEANDLLESFASPPFTAEKKDATCASVLKGICQAESVTVPEIYQPPVEPEEDMMATRDASLGGAFPSTPPAPAPSQPGRTPSLPVPAAFPTSGQAGRPGTLAGQGSQFGTRGGTGTRFGSSTTGGSSAGRISADYDLKRKELELQRVKLEAEAERLKQEEVLEATRAMLEEERGMLAAARDEFARQERDRAQRAEQERLKLEEERTRLESQTADVERKRREQERLEQEIQLRAQLEFQKFQEERKQREEEWSRQREEIERSLQEREEQFLLREQQNFRKLKDEREKLQKLQAEFEGGTVKNQSEAEAAVRAQLAQLEAERQRLAGEQAELDRRLLAQNQEFTRLREQFDAAEREIEDRHRRLAEEEAAAAQRREQEMEDERRQLAAEREQLEAQHSALAAERELGLGATLFATEQQRENEAALARLAGVEARLAAERDSLAAAAAERERRLSAELAQARQDLEKERASLARESERARETGLAELDGERQTIAATKAALAAREAALATEVGDKTRALEAQLALQQQEINAARASLDAERQRLDAEQARLAAGFEQEKAAFASELQERRQREDADHQRRMTERSAELARLEAEQTAKLAALRSEVTAEETRLQQQKQEVFTQERLITRMDQEASYEDAETLEKLEAEQKRLEGQRGEIEQKILELQKAQKKRLVTIVVGIIIAAIVASGAGYIIKGRLRDTTEVKGQGAWAQFEKELKAASTAKDWTGLLNWSVVTHDHYETKETDEVAKNFYKSKRGLVIQDAASAVTGLLASLDAGTPPPAAAMDKLRQNLAIVEKWDGIPPERALLRTRIEVPWLIGQKNPSGALTAYTAAAKTEAFIPRMKPELTLAVQGLLDDFLADHALDKRDEIFDLIRKLPEEARNSAPNSWLLLHLIQVEKFRSAPASADNYSNALANVNSPATGDLTKAFYAADPGWAKILQPEADRVLAVIKEHPEFITRLEAPLTATAEQWKTDEPYLMLAEASPVTQKKLDYYKAAEKLTGSPEARARVGGYYVQMAMELQKQGKTAEAKQLIGEALTRIKETANAGNAEAMFLLADVTRQALTGPKNLDEAISWAQKARDKGHPDAAFTLGLCYLEKAEDKPDAATLQLAADAFTAATAEKTSKNATRAWYFLAQTASMKKDNAALTAALEKGAQFDQPDCLFMLGQCQMAGPPYYPAANLTLGRDNLTKAARLAHPGARAALKKYATGWKSSGLPADKEWLRKNADLIEE